MFKGTIFDNRYASTQHKVPFSDKIVNNDIDAYEKYPKYNYLYNKLWVAKTQNLQCNTMDNPPTKDLYPVFIKPIINLRGANLDCFKIHNEREYNKYKDRKDLFWCEYIDKNEGSTDFIVDNGVILFELTYNIENEKGDFLQTITKISPSNQCPYKVKEWLKKHTKGYSGIINLQYRGDIIIECGLRFDFGGNFIQFTNNTKIIQTINNYYETGKWNYLTKEEFHFNDIYHYGCFCFYPTIYYIPAPIVILLCSLFNINYFNFYIDNGKNHFIFLTITDSDKTKLERTKYLLEWMMRILNWFFILGFITLFYTSFSLYPTLKKKQKTQFIFYSSIFIVAYLTRFLNPPKYIRRII